MSSPADEALPRWSPDPRLVLAGSVWVLVGAGTHLVVAEPLIVVVMAIVSLLAAVVTALTAPAAGTAAAPLSDTRTEVRPIDLVAGFSLERDRR